MGLFSRLMKRFSSSRSRSGETEGPEKLNTPYADFVVIDVETTGLSANRDKVIQVAAVRYVNHKVAEKYAAYVNPGRPIPREASRVNGITDSMVCTAAEFKGIQDVYFAFVEQSPLVVGYNINFDLKFLSAESGVKLFSEWRYVDVLSLARKALPMLENYKLSTVSRYVGFNAKFHDALADCRACGEVLNYLCRKQLIPTDIIPEPPKTYDAPPPSQTGRESTYSNPYISCDLSQQDFETAFGLWSQGEEKRKNGDIEAALRLFDSAREIGYTAPVIYESYAKVYRKLKDYEKEISILDDAIRQFNGPIANGFILRRSRAGELLLAQKNREEANAQKALEREKKAELRRLKQEMEAAKPKQSVKRAVIQFTDDGTVIKEFESVSAAAREVGIDSKCIRDAAYGRQKHAGGFCWRYAVPEIEENP